MANYPFPQATPSPVVGSVNTTAQVLAAGTKILPNANLVYISTASSVTTTSVPTIAPGENGQELTLYNSGSYNYTIKDAASLASSGLKLNSPNVTLLPGCTIKFIYVTGLGWKQVTPVEQPQTSSTQTLVAGTAILANARTVAITTASSVTSTAAPTIAAGYNGQRLTIVNVGSNNYVISDEGTLASSNILLSGTTATIATKGCITLVYNSTLAKWIQESVGRGVVIAS